MKVSSFSRAFLGVLLFLSNSTGYATTTLCREFENFQKTCEEPDGEECEDQFIQEEATKQEKYPNDIRKDIQKKLKKCGVSGGSSGTGTVTKGLGAAAAGLGVVGAGLTIAQRTKELRAPPPPSPSQTLINLSST